MRPPTDYEILKGIYNRYREEFPAYVKEAKEQNRRDSKILVPIDVEAIAKHFGVDEDSMFGRLYYHLEPKYGEAREEGKPKKTFFTPKAGNDQNCVNFPHLEAVVANLWRGARTSGHGYSPGIAPSGSRLSDDLRLCASGLSSTFTQCHPRGAALFRR